MTDGQLALLLALAKVVMSGLDTPRGDRVKIQDLVAAVSAERKAD